MLLAGGCGLPRDPRDTLERVQADSTLRAGISADPPWTEVPGGERAEVEAELLMRFDEELGVQVHWVEGSESALVEAWQPSGCSRNAVRVTGWVRCSSSSQERDLFGSR